MAQTAARQISQYDGPDWLIKVPIKGATTVYHGGMVGVVAGGYWAPATTAIAALGVADLQNWDDVPRTGQASVFGETTGQSIVNSGADGARHMNVRQGVFKFANKAGDLVTETLIGQTVYVEDSMTVRATGAGSVAAGKLIGFDDRDGSPLVVVDRSGGNGYGRM